MDQINIDGLEVPPIETPVVPVEVKVTPVALAKVECTRDTRGDADCAVKDCEDCN